jgi:hypothetical protein
MIKRISLVIAFFLTLTLCFAQYGNEWINYNQKYFKIYVSQNGIYRIPYSTLQSAGIPVSTTDPRSFQVFHNGKEEYIYIPGEQSGMMQSGSYIEFVGKRNNGWLDSALYQGNSAQANPDYSLFNDSSAYFLTWNSSINNRRMIVENDTAFVTYTPEVYFDVVVRENYTSKYYIGNTLTGSLSDPDYTTGEGWFDNDMNIDPGSVSSVIKNLSLPNRYTSGPDAKVWITMIGASNTSGVTPDHHLRIQFGGITIDTLYEGYGTFRFYRTVSPSALNNTTGFTISIIDDLGIVSDRNAVSFIQVRYPHTTNLGMVSSQFFYVNDAPFSTKSYFNLSGLNAAPGDTVRCYDITNHRRIKTKWSGTNIKFLVPNNGNEKQCYILTDNLIHNVSRLYTVGPGNKFVNYKAEANSLKADYFIITHSSLWSDVQQYAAYRNTTGYSSLMVDVDYLWDQYAYGILKDPLAIRNFMKEAYQTYDERPKDLFLIGKGYRAGQDGANPGYRNSAYYFNQTLVPSIGNPPCDNLFTAGIVDAMYQPAVPTGRLAARNGNHVDLYLNKMIEYETAQHTPQEWMKNILHFGGGSNTSQATLISSYLHTYQLLLEDTLFGGYVRSFIKSSTDPIVNNQSDSLKDIINGGVSLMTFFGHAAGVGFDQSIDHPSEYNNNGKYPLLVANSCLAGDLYIDGPVSSEEFVLIPNKGTIGYLASVSSGYMQQLHMYSTELNTNISSRYYGHSIGEIIQKTIAAVQTTDLIMKETCLAMTLHGDPALKINSFEKPDYMINAANVYFTPLNITNEVDTFSVNVISTNLGRAVADSFVVRVLRTKPDGSTSEYFKKIRATFFKDTISFEMPVDVVNGLGMNTFSVTLDYYANIDEMSETNNTTETFLLIKSANIVPIWPYEYAVIPALPVTLKASTGYAFASPQAWVFQLDTTDAFNSPILQQTTITHSGGVVTWTPLFPITTDSIVYYWRVSPEQTGTTTYNWRESSFQYINGKRGWGQAHFFQFKNDDYTYVSYNKPQRKFEFVNNILSLDCQTGYWPNIQWNEEWYALNGNNKYLWAYLGTSGNGMIVAYFDSISGQPFHGPTSGANDFAWEFSCDDTNSMNTLAQFINAIPSGDYVLAYSHRNHNAQNWTENLYQAFESFGSAACRLLVNDRPYIIFGKKGNAPPNSNESMGASILDIIKIEDSIVTKWTTGTIVSERIGPAVSWGSLHWRVKSAEGINSDYVRLSVIGTNASGLSDTLIRNLPPDSADIYNLSSRINAQQWPYLNLCAHMSDDSMHTPAQPVRWQVLYEGEPETALNPDKFFYLHNDTLNEGETLHFAVATENISEYNMDSLLIKYWIVDKNRTMIPLGSFRHRPHPAGDVLIDSISTSTAGLPGLNSIWIEVNPANDQPEQYHFNNIGEVYFYVNQDKANPMLDVTFDGVHIMDGDIVSAKPEILMMVKDENKYLPLNDTSDYKVWIVEPGSSTQRRIYFRNLDTLDFVPATLPENRAHIRYRPVFPEDGVYTLIVRAQDRTGNESAVNDYKISFEVINKPGITAVMNWPNPFTTATHFVFTLTGSEVPEFFMIQIMTITGKVVKEIRMDELGPIHVGTNITDYAWDGTDMYGDRLANGVYLYRVITRLNDNRMDRINSDADQYFKKEFGKMYLMR